MSYVNPCFKVFIFVVTIFLLISCTPDGRADIIAGGNLAATRARTGKLTGNYGVIGINDGKGKFTIMKPTQFGLNLSGDVRHLIVVDDILIAGVNKQPVLTYRRQALKKP